MAQVNDLGLTEEQMQKVKRAFRMLDANGNGMISTAELRQAAQVLGYNPTRKEAEQMVNTVDNDRNGQIDFKEFASMMRDRYGALEYQEMVVRDAFKQLDRDGSGFVDYEELRLALAEKGEEPISDEQFQRIIGELDVNQDGKIDYAELSQKMCTPI
ncbi:uncharacterized protein [Littorina saxatilis]|uniref:EF-hand domain-containing protein n=1 Tax=Littorina saxatilis TaxID=31220 RepID=A0AAN9G315_9CAEN